MSTMELEMPVSEVEVFDDVKKNSLTVLDRAYEVSVIRTQEDFVIAGEFRVTVNRWKKEALEKCNPVVVAAKAAHTAACALRDEAIKPLEQSMNILDPALTAWTTEQERLRRIEQERLQKEAKEREENNALAEAAVIAEGGDHERAAQVLDTVQIAPVVVPVAAKIAGMSFPESWSCDPNVDMKLVIEAVFKGQIPMEAIQPNMVLANKMAKALKGSFNWPGFKAVSKKIVSSR